MTHAALNADVRDFLDKNIKNYEELQVLLLMHAHPYKMWDVVDVSQNLRIEPFEAASVLKRLYEGKLIDHEPTCGSFYQYQYTPQPEEKDQHVSRLAMAFDKARDEIVAYLFHRNNKALRAFSNAFKFKKDK